MVPHSAFSHVVVPLDGNVHTERAVPVASALARQAGTTLRFVMVTPHADQVSAAEDYLVKLASASDLHSVSTEVIVGANAGPTLAEFLAAQLSTLVVLSSHARRNLAELVLGNVAVEVLHRSPHPVVLVGPHTIVPPASHRYRELVICLDNGSPAGPLVNLSARFAGELDLHPHLYRLAAEPGAPDGADTALVTGLAAQLASIGLPAAWDVAEGDAATNILAYAADRADVLLALAADGDRYDNFGRRSVTVAVARQSPVPVLVQGPSYHPEHVPLPDL